MAPSLGVCTDSTPCPAFRSLQSWPRGHIRGTGPKNTPRSSLSPLPHSWWEAQVSCLGPSHPRPGSLACSLLTLGTQAQGSLLVSQHAHLLLTPPGPDPCIYMRTPLSQGSPFSIPKSSCGRVAVPLPLPDTFAILLSYPTGPHPIPPHPHPSHPQCC